MRLSITGMVGFVNAGLRSDSRMGHYRNSPVFILTTHKLTLSYRQINKPWRFIAGKTLICFKQDIKFGALKSPLTLRWPDRWFDGGKQMAFETREQVLEKMLSKEKPQCPHCGKEMNIWEVPPMNFSDGLGWGTPFLYILKKSWLTKRFKPITCYYNFLGIHVMIR